MIELYKMQSYQEMASQQEANSKICEQCQISQCAGYEKQTVTDLNAIKLEISYIPHL